MSEYNLVTRQAEGIRISEGKYVVFIDITLRRRFPFSLLGAFRTVKLRIYKMPDETGVQAKEEVQ